MAQHGRLTVSPLLESQREAFYRLAARTFGEHDDPDHMARHFQRRDEADLRWPVERRGVVGADGSLLGGYLIHDRQMRMGPALLRTACIGGVVTAPQSRRQGVGRLLMEDAVTYARANRYALLLLDGIPNFYSKFGYARVFDETLVVIDRRSVPQDPPTGWTIRDASVEDAPVCLDLYRRHAGRYAGSFDWDLDQMRTRLRFNVEGGRAVQLAVGPSGSVDGYLVLNEPGSPVAREVGANSWPAALTLLHYHLPLATSSSGEMSSLSWRIPVDSPTYLILADHLLSPSVQGGEQSIIPLKTVSNFRNDSGYQGRVADLQALLPSLLPVLQERWAKSSRGPRGRLTIRVGDETMGLELSDDVTLCRDAVGLDVCLDPGTLAQLVLGFRPAWWLAHSRRSVSDEALPALEVLFPPCDFSIAGSDDF